MKKAKLQAATIGGSADDIEAQFYEALQQGDLEKLMACWADEDDIVCIQPSGFRVVGSASIRSMFVTLFANNPIAKRPEHICKVETITSAMHNVVECLNRNEGSQDTYSLATNVYQRTPQGWRMVAHHASFAVPDIKQDISNAVQVLH